jgi:hypothetical protein
MAQAASASGAQALPELASVYWRPRVDEDRLRRRGTLWTTVTVAHVIPLVVVAVLIVLLQPLAVAVSLIALAKAWLIPALYAQRGANVARPRRRLGDGPERRALGLLGDLVGHDARDLYRETGLVLERGALGVWLVGEAGAVLVRAGGRRVFCYCVRVPDDDLPSADRTSHLLLALREDEAGFATVANLAFCGARWRLRRRLDRRMRPALAEAAAAARAGG